MSFGWVGKELGKVKKGAERLVHDPAKWAENAGRSVGAAAKQAAPILPFVTPLGPLGAAAIAAGGSAAAGGSRGDDLKSAAYGYGGGKAAEAFGAGSGNGFSIPGLGTIEQLASHIPGLQGLGSGDGGLPGGNAIPLGLAAADIASAAEASRKADKFASEGWDIAKGNWDANDPLRTQGRAQLLHPGTPNLGALDSIRGQIPGGLPQGAQTLSGASSALAGLNVPPAAPSSPEMALTPPPALSGQGPIAATRPDPNVKGIGPKAGFSPQVRF